MDRHELVDELWAEAGIVPSPYSAEQTLPLRRAPSSIKGLTHLERLLEVAGRVTQQLHTALSESGVKQPRLAGERSRTVSEITGWVAGGS